MNIENHQILLPFIYSSLLFFACWIVAIHYHRYAKLIALFYAFLLIYTVYAVAMEYHYHRTSLPMLAKVSAVHSISSVERRMIDTCHYLRGGRVDCSTLYDYDLTWRVNDKTWVYHVEDKRVEPNGAMCVNVVKDKPAIGKPCENIFFNASHLPVLIAIWAISAIIFLVVLGYQLKMRRMSSHSASGLYRIYTISRQLLLETNNWQEAMQFVSGKYLLRSTKKSVEEIYIGGKKQKIGCVSYYVRPRKRRKEVGL